MNENQAVNFEIFKGGWDRAAHSFGYSNISPSRFTEKRRLSMKDNNRSNNL